MKKITSLTALLFFCVLSYAQEVIKNVYFAQTHVIEPEYLVPNANEPLKLTTDRDALIKVHVIDPAGSASPVVKATLTLNSNTTDIILSGPANLPTSFNSALGQVNHNFTDCFTGTIPKSWMRHGLQVSIQAGTVTKIYNNLVFSAPNKIRMTNLEVNFNIEQNSEYPIGWEAEFEEKFPSSALEVQDVRVVFNEISVPPSSGRIAVRMKTTGDYQAITGFTGFGTNSGPQNNTATQWKAALRDAAGSRYGSMKYFHVGWKFENRANKGVGGGFSSVSRRGSSSLGIFLHEVGHALSLPHWSTTNYPYFGEMYGIAAPSMNMHSGPIWCFDARSQTFIPPTQSGVTPLTYKNDPMTGGGNRFKEPGYLTNHFSDYSANRMRQMLENHITVYNSTLGAYAKWNSTNMDYTNVQDNTGNVKYPVLRDASVISLMAAVSSKTSQANIVYKPVGPYISGLIDVFDPRVAADRVQADTYYCPSNGCDTTLKIEQGGAIKYLMLPTGLDETLSEIDAASFITRAVNVPASDGTVNKVELLYTPDSEINGLPASPVVLASWGTSAGIVYTFNGTNWSPSDPNGISVVIDDLIIQSGNTTISTNTNAQSITVNPGASLTVNEGVNLTVNNRLVLESSSNNFSSLILDGTITGPIKYERYASLIGSATEGTNDLIAPPLSGQNFGDFVSSNLYLSSLNTTRAFGFYNNNTGVYQNYDTSTDSGAILNAGIGYRVATNDGSKLTFTGNVETGNVNVPITSGSSTLWNLIGNPYPSYLHLGDFISANAANLRNPYVAVYGYDGDNSDGAFWKVYDLNVPNTLITPGQGFIVGAPVAGSSISFTPSMQRIGSNDDFIAGRSFTKNNTNYAKFVLELDKNSNINSRTQFFFRDINTNGLDLGYDTGVLNAFNNNTNLYSKLLENSNGEQLYNQALAYSALTNATIKLGVAGNAGEYLTFSLNPSESSIPEGTNVYLEDLNTGTFTLLNNSAYSISLSENINETERFRLRFTNTTLSTTENSIKHIKIYIPNETKTLHIEGKIETGTVVKLYDLSGRLVNKKVIKNATKYHNINLNYLETGFYIVNLEYQNNRLNKKIIIK